ncbi:hypothetical protein PR002_g20633 [Phytophthora rubi]|uniref:Uncharacterized protein n=1 Tax=Phytophthora rubi TaxID=129364 RepID=A0A6A3JJG8_9STRA|nr:hypothetical protein PR002_g20633 [Phytophthora rubi]
MGGKGARASTATTSGAGGKRSKKTPKKAVQPKPKEQATAEATGLPRRPTLRAHAPVDCVQATHGFARDDSDDVETPVGVMTPVVAMTMVDMLTLSMLTVEALALMMVEMLTVEALAMLTVESQILLMLVALWEMLRMRMTQVTSLKENQLRLLLATTTCCTMSVLQRPHEMLKQHWRCRALLNRRKN